MRVRARCRAQQRPLRGLLHSAMQRYFTRYCPALCIAIAIAIQYSTYSRAGGVPTRHTHKWDDLHTRHLLESTHTNTHKHKQTHSAARQSTVRAHAVAPPSSSEEGASPPPPASCNSVAISHAEAMDCFSSPALRWLLGLRNVVLLALLVIYNDESYYTLPPYDTARRAGSYGHDVRAGYLPGGRGSWEASPGPLGLHVVQFWSNWADRRTSLPRLGSAILSLPRRRGIVVRS